MWWTRMLAYRSSSSEHIASCRGLDPTDQTDVDQSTIDRLPHTLHEGRTSRDRRARMSDRAGCVSQPVAPEPRAALLTTPQGSKACVPVSDEATPKKKG